MGQRIPAGDVVRGHVVAENDLRVVEYLAEDFLGLRADVTHRTLAPQ